MRAGGFIPAISVFLTLQFFDWGKSMANEEQLALLKRSVKEWNAWREKNPDMEIDLDGAILLGANLVGANLSNACLRRAILDNANLQTAYLCEANLHKARIQRANLHRANLREAILSEVNLSEAILRGANLKSALLKGATLRKTNLRGASLNGADCTKALLDGAALVEADLSGVEFEDSNLSGADCRRANLGKASFAGADLGWAKLMEADITETGFYGTNLRYADLSGAFAAGAVFAGTVFANTNLSGVKSLESARHDGPSTLGIDTLMRSGKGNPQEFLVGCGVPDIWIEYLRSLVGLPIDLHSCFISYSSQDEEMAKRLQSRLRDDGLRIWFAPEDMKGGRKMWDQIDQAISLHDKLLLVLSEHSMESEWVKTEIRRARRREAEEGRQVLFPIRAVSMDAIKAWKAFDADTGKDMAVEIREYHIPDLTNWKDHVAFESAHERLLKDLQPAPGD
jgi:uncharacterized protein YjbI with pentapeptide repeats